MVPWTQNILSPVKHNLTDHFGNLEKRYLGVKLGKLVLLKCSKAKYFLKFSVPQPIAIVLRLISGNKV